MADNSALLSSKTLGSICLIATHNSGAYNLSNKIINIDSYGPPFTTLYNSLDDVAFATGQPLNHLVGLFTAGIRASSECTTKDIYSQLMDGNRALDLRVFIFENDIYIAHALQGPSLVNVLTQIWKFLQGTNGEIVFITMGHPYGFNQTYIDRLAFLLEPFLISRIAITPASYPGDLLSYTYAQLVTNRSSRAIFVIDNSINPDANSFFSTSLYSPPNGGSNKLYGFYTNSNDIAVVINNQTANYARSREILAPAAIYMTLTPTYNDVVSIINTIVADLRPLMKSLALAIFRRALMTENIDDLNLTYTSLYDIYVQQNMIARRANIVANIQPRIPSSTKNSIFLIYTDFYENNKDMIDFAISFSTK
ncbi:hypothetical protein I4U23_004003 [Adineta vaga]|nr:hypothetical protein I4U23_004003 [Adineta vaga]